MSQMGELINVAQERLRAQGGRMTIQRRLLFSILDSLGEHPTAEELLLLARKQDPDLNLSTVYRTLRWLEAESLVSSRVFAEERRQERFDAALPIRCDQRPISRTEWSQSGNRLNCVVWIMLKMPPDEEWQ
jgi:Fe2+ or Zn2+ uptake regulation protein